MIFIHILYQVCTFKIVLKKFRLCFDWFHKITIEFNNNVDYLYNIRYNENNKVKI